MASGSAPPNIMIGRSTPAFRMASASSKLPVASAKVSPSSARVRATAAAPCP